MPPEIPCLCLFCFCAVLLLKCGPHGLCGNRLGTSGLILLCVSDKSERYYVFSACFYIGNVMSDNWRQHCHLTNVRLIKMTFFYICK
jgi:hypothetical protein